MNGGAGQPHQVGRIALEFASGSFASAVQLRLRAEELAWRHLPALVESVFDALCPADLEVRIARLDLDLGELAAPVLEQDFLPTLELSLRAALGEAIAAALHGAGAQAQVRALPAALLAQFETYLASGVLPSHGSADAYDPAAILLRLCTEQPAALVAMLRQHARHAGMVERLVLQADAQGWAALLAALAPADAALILAYLAEMRQIHAGGQARLRLTLPAFERTLAVLTLTFLLHEPGSQFNRRSYLAFLLEGVARTEGIGYAALLTLLRQAAAQTRTAAPLTGPLLGVLDELLAGLGAGDGVPVAEGAPGGADAALASAQAGRLEPLLAQLRGAAPEAMAQLVKAMPARVFASLVRLLQPQHAALILANLDKLALLHRQRPQIKLSAPRFEQQLRLTALRYLMLEAGSQFNRLSWLRRVLHGLAEAGGVSYRVLLRSFTAALDDLRERLPLSGSLPEGLALLLDELGQYDAAAAADERGAAMLARLREPGLDLARVDAILAGATAAQFAELVAAIEPGHAAGILDDVARLGAIVRAWAPGPSPQRLEALALHALLGGAGQAFDHRLWLRRCVRALADAAALSWDSVVVAIAAGAAVMPDDHGALRAALGDIAAADGAPSPPLAYRYPADAADTPAALAQAERFLRSGLPQAGGAALSTVAAAQPQAFGALLRRLLGAASNQAAALTGRLLDWMLPEEIVASLLPGQGGQAVRWAEALAAQPGVSMEAAWRRVLGAALHGQALAAPAERDWPGERLDRVALLRHWLDHAALPWWAPGGTSADALLAGLRHSTLAELHALLDDPREERIVWRLRRLYKGLDRQAGMELISRLAPWAVAPAGPLASLARGADAAALTDVRLRAAAATLRAAPLDLARLAREVPAQPPPAPPPPMPPALGPDGKAAVRQALLAWLGGAAGGLQPGRPGFAGTCPDPQALRLLAQLLARQDPDLDAALLAGLRDPGARARIIAQLPDEILARLVHRLAPAMARFMLDLKTVLQAAWSNTGPLGARVEPGRQLWHMLFAALADPPVPTQRALAARLLEGLSADSAEHAERLRTRAQGLARQGGYANLSGALQRPPGAPAPLAPIAPPQPRARAAGRQGSGTGGEADIVYVANAGLVLVHAFLPHLFKRLDVLSGDAGKDTRIEGNDAATRAVHLLQYLVDGRCNAPEPALALNKLLCGLELDTPVARVSVPAAQELEVCHELLDAVIGNWSSIRNSSRAGLRETFLQRDGRLERRDGKWTLTVSRKTVDVLVDQIPWSLAVVLHPWMPKELAVVW